MNTTFKSTTVGLIALTFLLVGIALGIVFGIDIDLSARRPQESEALIEIHGPQPFHPERYYKEARICWTNITTRIGGAGEWTSVTNVLGYTPHSFDKQTGLGQYIEYR